MTNPQMNYIVRFQKAIIIMELKTFSKVDFSDKYIFHLSLIRLESSISLAVLIYVI